MITNARQSQKGLSLIELMIAITLSIFITAAMISLFVNSKQNYRLNENMSRLQENARFAMAFLARDIRMSDYRTCVTADRLATAIAGTNNAGLNNSDTVTVIWQTNACGASATSDTMIYSIGNGSSGAPALFRSVNGVNTELVEGIENLQILYGEDTDNDDAPNYFVDSASITNMAQAVSVRLTVVARTLETNLTAGGGRITRNFTSTVTLRNRLP
jgi:type IV pilus assembly protein PilW